jgi:hypothetical protein
MSAPYASEDRKMTGINKDTTANVAIIPAPGAGKRIAIDFLYLNPSGGANIATLTGSDVIPFALNDNQSLQISNDFHNYTGVFLLNDNQAFSFGLSASTQVEGYAIYRIIGG